MCVNEILTISYPSSAGKMGVHVWVGGWEGGGCMGVCVCARARARAEN